MNQTFSKIRPKTTESNQRNSQHQQLFTQLFQKINSYYCLDERFRPRTQNRQRQYIPINQTSSELYDVSENIIDRLCPTIQQDAKFMFIKTRERALRKPLSGQKRKKIIEEPKFQLNPIKKSTIIQENLDIPPPIQKKTIEPKVDHSFYIINSINMLKTMKQDKMKLFNCSFN